MVQSSPETSNHKKNCKNCWWIFRLILYDDQKEVYVKEDYEKEEEEEDDEEEED